MAKLNKIERVRSNIEGLDPLIEGGVIKGSTNIVVGSSGSGKSIFAAQFLVGGLKKGEKCLYVNFEEKKEDFYNNMLEFGWDLKEYEIKGLFFYLEYAPVKVKGLLDEGGGMIESIILKNNISRLVFDNLASFFSLFRNNADKKEAYISLFNMIKSWKCTTVLTYEEELKDEKYSEPMGLECDSVIALYYVMKDKERERFIEILKMRGTDHSNKMYKFEIKYSGISIGKKPSSFNK